MKTAIKIFLVSILLFVAGCELFKTKSVKKDEPAPFDGVLIGKKEKAEEETSEAETEPVKTDQVESDGFEPRTDPEEQPWTIPDSTKSGTSGSTELTE